MSLLRWDPEKNQKLIAERGVSFEEVAWAIENGMVLEETEHPNPSQYGHQKMLIVELNGYAYLVPFVELNDDIFLKTIIPSRKATKKYLGGKQQ